MRQVPGPQSIASPPSIGNATVGALLFAYAFPPAAHAVADQLPILLFGLCAPAVSTRWVTNRQVRTFPNVGLASRAAISLIAIIAASHPAVSEQTCRTCTCHACQRGKCDYCRKPSPTEGFQHPGTVFRVIQRIYHLFGLAKNLVEHPCSSVAMDLRGESVRATQRASLSELYHHAKHQKCQGGSHGRKRST